jgi:type II secretory pathway pseudopilin PulG
MKRVKIKFKVKNNSNNSSGFSLVETLIYVFLVVLLTIAVVNSLVFMTKSYRDIRSARAISLSANTLLNRFSYEVKRADDLDGVFGTASSTLTLTKSTSTTAFSLEASSSRVLITTDGIQDYLTSSEVRVTALTFLKLQATSTSKGTVIQFTISNTNGNTTRIENFESSAMIRNFKP